MARRATLANDAELGCPPLQSRHVPGTKMLTLSAALLQMLLQLPWMKCDDGQEGRGQVGTPWRAPGPTLELALPLENAAAQRTVS